MLGAQCRAACACLVALAGLVLAGGCTANPSPSPADAVTLGGCARRPGRDDDAAGCHDGAGRHDCGAARGGNQSGAVRLVAGGDAGGRGRRAGADRGEPPARPSWAFPCCSRRPEPEPDDQTAQEIDAVGRPSGDRGRTGRGPATPTADPAATPSRTPPVAVRPGEALDGLLVLALDRARRAGPPSPPPGPPAPGCCCWPTPIRAPATRSSRRWPGQPVDRVLARGQTRSARPSGCAGGSTPRRPACCCPAAGRCVFPGRRMVALYGHPGYTGARRRWASSRVDAAIARAKQVAGELPAAGRRARGPRVRDHRDRGVGAGRRRTATTPASRRSTHLRPWVDAARAAGIYVVLDLQPGRTDFLTQAKRYEELLAPAARRPGARPGVAALARTSVHMVQIGSVSAAEINAHGGLAGRADPGHTSCRRRC